jgi:hypothetical protein
VYLVDVEPDGDLDLVYTTVADNAVHTILNECLPVE